MEGNKYIARINYQQGKHHRQILRSNIAPETYEKLQFNDNPSLKYQNAYKALYHDQLQRQILEHEGQRGRNTIQKDYSTKHKPYRSITDQNCNYSPIKVPNFRDYDIQRANKFEQLINKNYDGGQSFYNLQQRYLQEINNRNKSLKEELQTQIDYKQIKKDEEKNKKNEQNQTFQKYTQLQNIIDQQNRLSKLQNSRILQEEIKQQAEYQITRNRAKQNYDMRGKGRHNPITNPIQYHIDNPYILKRIQDRDILR